MADIKWIKIATDIFDDEKILLIESMPDADALIVVWFKLLVLAGKNNNDGVLMMNSAIPYTDEMLSAIFRKPLNTVRLALGVFEKFGMIEIVNETITIPKWEKHQALEGMDKVREQTRERVRRHREKQKQIAGNVSRNVTETLGNALELEQELDKDKEISSCCYTDVWKAIKPEEVDKLYEQYKDAGDLIQAVYEEVKSKGRTIEKPYEYIVGYANNKQWQKL